MSEKLRAIRDGLNRGDDVLVTGHGARPRRARVVEVLRAAARVRYDDDGGEVQTVLFKSITRIGGQSIRTRVRREPEQAPQPAASPATIVRAVPLEVVEQPEPEPEPAPADELAVWLDMGRDMAARMRDEIAALEEQETSLREDARRMFELAEQSEQQRNELQRKLAAVLEITGNGSKESKTA